MTAKDGLPCKRCGGNEWYNRDCVACKKERDRHYRAENRERTGEVKRRWRAANKDKVVEYASRWKSANPDKRAEQDRRYRAANPEKKKAKDNRRRTRKTEAGGSFTAAEWKALCEQYNNRCACCGQKKPLTFDHVIPVSKGGTSDISNGQPLCKSCNSSKNDKIIDYRTKPGVLRWIQKKLFD